MRHRTHLDASMELIGTFLFGPKEGSSIINSVRETYLPLVDDWGCLKSMVKHIIYLKSDHIIYLYLLNYTMSYVMACTESKLKN